MRTYRTATTASILISVLSFYHAQAEELNKDMIKQILLKANTKRHKKYKKKYAKTPKKSHNKTPIKKHSEKKSDDVKKTTVAKVKKKKEPKHISYEFFAPQNIHVIDRDNTYKKNSGYVGFKIIKKANSINKRVEPISDEMLLADSSSDIPTVDTSCGKHNRQEKAVLEGWLIGE